MPCIYVGTNPSISTPPFIARNDLDIHSCLRISFIPRFPSFTQIMFPLGYIAHGHIVHGPEDTTYMATYLLLIQPDMATNFRPIKSIPAKQKNQSLQKPNVAILHFLDKYFLVSIVHFE